MSPVAGDPGRNTAPLWSVSFRREREATWRELEGLVARVEARGARALAASELARLPVLYRGALSSLAVAQAVCLDHALLAYLESLVQRAFFCLYGPKRGFFEVIAGFLRRRFPEAVRRSRGSLAIAAACLLAGVATGLVLTSRDQDLFYSFVDAGMAAGRDPTASTEELRRTLFGAGNGRLDLLFLFASFLFTHNAGTGLLSFALGFLAGLPVLLLLFHNGIIVGALAALFHSRGLEVEFWGWLLPHGVTEMLAIVLCGTAGLKLADGLLNPGRLSRLETLGERGREAGIIVMGAVLLLFLAGLLEGIFRQTVHETPLRYGVAGVSALAWMVYFLGCGRGAAE